MPSGPRGWSGPDACRRELTPRAGPLLSRAEIRTAARHRFPHDLQLRRRSGPIALAGKPRRFDAIKPIVSAILNCLAILLFVSAVTNTAALPARSAKPSVWESSNDPTHSGAADFWQLFEPNAPPSARRHVAVFSIDQNLVTNGPPDKLRKFFAYFCLPSRRAGRRPARSSLSS